ncbi:hypothetical protein KYT24_004382 [Salmonella enterica]|nr:hypothetical protein [Salmonella enterica]
MLDLNPETGRVILSLGRKPKPLIESRPQAAENVIKECGRQLDHLFNKRRGTNTRARLDIQIPAYNHAGSPKAEPREASRIMQALTQHAKGLTPYCYYEELAYYWPHLFENITDRKLLTRSAIKQIKDFARQRNGAGIKAELQHYLDSIPYIRAAAAAEIPAYNIDGTAEPLNKCDQQRAEWALLAFRVLLKQEEAAQQQERERKEQQRQEPITVKRRRMSDSIR